MLNTFLSSTPSQQEASETQQLEVDSSLANAFCLVAEKIIFGFEEIASSLSKIFVKIPAIIAIIIEVTAR